MPRLKNAPRVKMTGAALYPKHLEIINAFIDTGSFGSQSEIIRDALELFYQKRMPGYIRVQEERLALKKLGNSERERIQNMTNEEYCERELFGTIDKQKQQCVLINKLNGMTTAIDLLVVKNHKIDDFAPQYHPDYKPR